MRRSKVIQPSQFHESEMVCGPCAWLQAEVRKPGYDFHAFWGIQKTRDE